MKQAEQRTWTVNYLTTRNKAIKICPNKEIHEVSIQNPILNSTFLMYNLMISIIIFFIYPKVYQTYSLNFRQHSASE